MAAWAKTWLVTFNALKTESLLISRKHNQALHPPVYKQDQPVKVVDVHKHLGLYIPRTVPGVSKLNTFHKKLGQVLI